jgi:polar amino acid transport system substrate-binding protein
MKISKITTLLGLSVCMAMPTISAAEEITVATGEFQPLYTAKTDTNGVVLQLVKAAFAAEGVTVKYKFFPWKRTFETVKAGNADAACCFFDTAERKQVVNYTQPIYAYANSFFHLKSTKFDWSSIEDLKKYRIGATTGYAYTPEFIEAEKSKAISVQRIANDNDNLKKLLGGRIDIFPLNSDVGYYTLKTKFTPEQAEQITSHPKPLFKDNVHVIVPKSSANGQRLIETFNKGVATIKENGTYQKIVDDYEKSK